MTALPMDRVATDSETEKLELLARRARDGAADPRVIDLAYRITRADRAPDDAARALHAWVRDVIEYVDERPERFQGAWYTAQVGRGDCDCQAILLGAMAMAIGLPVEFVAWSGVDEILRHVVATVNGAWAETTVPALWGEHPARAAHRLAAHRPGA